MRLKVAYLWGVIVALLVALAMCSTSHAADVTLDYGEFKGLVQQ